MANRAGPGTKAWPRADYYELAPWFDIFSWSPAPEGTVDAPVTQVHLHLCADGGSARFVLRFKGPDTLDRLIAALQDHRRDVWGEPIASPEEKP